MTRRYLTSRIGSTLIALPLAAIPRPAFASEAEEAAWLYEHRDEIDATWKPVLDADGKPLTPAEIRERHMRKSK